MIFRSFLIVATPYVYVHICIHVPSTYERVWSFLYLLSFYTHMRIYSYVQTHIYIYTQRTRCSASGARALQIYSYEMICIFLYLLMFLQSHVSLHICTHINIYIYSAHKMQRLGSTRATYILIRTGMYSRICTHMFTLTCVFTRMCTHIYIYTQRI